MKVYPINLCVENKHCVVVGGGKVAYRKVCGLLDAGANVEVISPEICAGIEKLLDDGRITLIRENYSADKLTGGAVLILATDDSELNHRAAEEGRAKHFLVNIVDDFDSDFITPSVIRRGDFLLTISTGGQSPALSKFVRQMLEKDFDSNFDEALRIMSKWRLIAIEKLPNPDARVKFWRDALTSEFWELLKAGEFRKLDEYFAALLKF